MKRALITGITGQDGSYLARILLASGYKVYGMTRKPLTDRAVESLEGIQQDIQFITGDLEDFSSLRYALSKSAPTEVYNLAAQSIVTYSWAQPLLTLETTGMGPIRLLEAVRLECPETKFFQASSSEMFGISNSLSDPLNAEYYPLSPYAAGKLLGYHMTRLYREKFNLFACSGVLFNHESPYRDAIFVSRKITLAAARIALGQQEQLKMGNMDVVRDWGFAGDYMTAVHKMVLAEKPKDYVIATGIGHTVQDMVRIAFDYVGLPWEKHVSSDTSLFRTLEAPKVLGKPENTMKDLDWKPTVDFKGLVEMMVEKDLQRLKRGAI